MTVHSIIPWIKYNVTVTSVTSVRQGKNEHRDPLEMVCHDYFSHLTPSHFARQATDGEIDVPVVRIETSQKAAKSIHINDLAAWIDARHAAAVKECDQLHGGEEISLLTTEALAGGRAFVFTASSVEGHPAGEFLTRRLYAAHEPSGRRPLTSSEHLFRDREAVRPAPQIAALLAPAIPRSRCHRRAAKLA